MNENEWLVLLLASLENIPVCVSLATAAADNRGFPLIYVNKCFEKSTGYKREEVVGKNCKFLQTGKDGATAEKESILAISTALSLGKPIKVRITNFHKDGTPFKNLLALKPICNDKGKNSLILMTHLLLFLILILILLFII